MKWTGSMWGWSRPTARLCASASACWKRLVSFSILMGRPRCQPVCEGKTTKIKTAEDAPCETRNVDCNTTKSIQEHASEAGQGIQHQRIPHERGGAHAAHPERVPRAHGSAAALQDQACRDLLRLGAHGAEPG